MGRPAHHAKSLIVAGPRDATYRLARRPSASSWSGWRAAGTRASKAAYVCHFPSSGPLQTTMSSSARIRMYAIRCPSEAMRRLPRIAVSARRVKGESATASAMMSFVFDKVF
jgi:hypothetical protein